MAQRIGELVMEPNAEVDTIFHHVDSYSQREYGFVTKRKSSPVPSPAPSKK